MEFTEEVIVLMMLGALLGVCIISRALDGAGLLAASAIGSIIGFLGHWTWLSLLIFFLLSASIATRWRYEEKKRLGFAEANDGSRGWKNAVANGGAPAIAVLLHDAMGSPGWGAIALSCSVAVAMSDTLASEIGVMDSRTRSIVSLRVVPTGANGGMSPTGMLSSVVGSLILAIAALGLMADDFVWSGLGAVVIISVAGWAGCQVDSILGETLENRGYLGKHSVNFLATSFGALVGYASFYVI